MWLALVMMFTMQSAPIQTIATDAMSQIESPTQAVARTPAEWTALWRRHAGDTALFGDMRLIGELSNVDLACLPIGDRFTMGPKHDVRAAEMLRAKSVLPIHYNTWPPIAQDGQAFARDLEGKGIKGLPLKAGESIEL
jgi:L-ascorbate metabolism protein UlaG (beta-lactamase superfamily)